MSRIKNLGKALSIVLLATFMSIVLIPIAYAMDVEWLKGIAIALTFSGLTVFLANSVLRLTQQIISVRNAVKQAYDRQLSTASFLERQLKDHFEIASQQFASRGINGSRTTGVSHGYGVDYEYARRQSVSTPNVHTFAVMSRSLKIRDSLALAASSGRWRERDLTQFFRLEAAGRLKDEEREVHHSALERRNLMRFAGVLLNQLNRATDLQDANNIYDYIARCWGYRVMPYVDRLLAVEAAMETNGYTQIEETLDRYGIDEAPLQKQLLSANGLALRGAPQTDPHEWISTINRIYDDAGLAQVTLLDTDSPDRDLYDRLDAERPHAITDGPRVTVLMPTYTADHKIYTAIRSLLKQTWENLEILIIDDGSPEETGTLLRELAGLDDRIKLFFLGSNRGAYIARNFGLDHATGEFITVHDDDDWSHPQKIEIQVKDLLADPAKVGNWSNHVRTTENLFFKRLNSNPELTQFNFSSIMFRKDVVNAIGGWNKVNRSGDSEFHARIEAYSGQTLLSPVAEPMSFTRTGGASLTQDEMNRGYLDSGRLFYMQVFQAAHRRARENGNWTPSMAQLPAGVPENLKEGQRNLKLGHYDLIYATDFRLSENASSAIAEIEALVDDGKRIGIVQMDSPLNPPGNSLQGSVLDLLDRRNDEISVLSLRDTASTDLFIVRDPSVAQYADQLETWIDAKSVILIVRSTSVLPDETGQICDLYDAASNLETLFTATPKVVAESESAKELSTIVGAESLFEETLWRGDIETFIEHADIPE